MSLSHPVVVPFHARFGVAAKKYQKCDGFLHVMFKI